MIGRHGRAGGRSGDVIAHPDGTIPTVGALRAPTMDRQLTLTRFIERAGSLFGAREVVSCNGGERERLTWRGIADRTARMVGALRRTGVKPGDRVATLAWNHHRHLELYFAVPAMGAVLHTVNPRLAPGQIDRILMDGGSRLIFADPDLRDLVPHRLEVADHEALVNAGPSEPFPELSEWTACGLCHTSGTTGDPKGVLYSHRALVLHALAIALPDGFGIAERDTVLPVVPMFHASAWGMPYAAAMTGAGLVLPGPRPNARRVAELLSAECVTFAAGVPMIWNEVLDELRREPRPLSPDLRIHAGGAPSPPSLVDAWEKELGVEVITGWGMTEISPVGAVTHPRANRRRPGSATAPVRPRDPEGAPDSGSAFGWAEGSSARYSQGTPLPLVETRITDDDARELARDGIGVGELEVRGPWVAGSYFGRDPEDDPDAFRDGWLRTGDIATMDAEGYIRLVDRSKDLVRSGGEWISSVQLENAIAGVGGVADAAVVAMPHPRWQERPCAFVVPKAPPDTYAEHSLRGEVLRELGSLFPKWWLPDRIEFIREIPRTATGKIDKRRLRIAAASPEDGK